MQTSPMPGWYGEVTLTAVALVALQRQLELEARLSNVQAVIHNQDNREHDLLDSDDYYQFEGGLAATIRHLSGQQPSMYHNDHSRPESPRIRRLGRGNRSGGSSTRRQSQMD